jgi:6-pyruvoyltetrahydropterin/6-carboxytetrahydropterin synthase
MNIELFYVYKDINFCYGHRLVDGYVGKCSNLHGHNGVARIYFKTNNVNEFGFVIDFNDIKNSVKKYIDDKWDHAVLVNQNDKDLIKFLSEQNQKFVIFDGNPTAELMAKTLYNKIMEIEYPSDIANYLVSVQIFETPSSCAVYSISE